MFSRAILTTIVSGTEKSIPTGPHTQPQNTRDTKTTRVDSPRRRPSRVGSITLPKTTFTTR